MNDIDITSAQYVSLEGTNSCVKAVINGAEWFVPIDPANRHYAEIMRQVEAGTLVIAEAD
jgi:hypothetical protein